MNKQPGDGKEKFYQPEDIHNTDGKTELLEDETGIPQLEFNLDDAPEHIRRLEAEMNDDMENILNSSKPMMPYHFSERYEQKLKDSLEEKFGREKAEMFLKIRAISRKAAEEEYKKFMISNGILPDTYIGTEKSCQSDLSISKHKFRRRKFSRSLKKSLFKLPKSNFVKAASALIFISLGVLILGKNEAKAYWWESIEFVINSYEEYSQIEAHKAVDKGDIEYPETIEKKYVPEKVAEGYEEVAREAAEKYIKIFYTNLGDKFYSYMQQTQDLGTHVDIERSQYKDCSLIYGVAYYLEGNNYCKLIWNYEDYIFILEGNLTKEQVMDIANTVALEKEVRNE